jgi:DNA polymerase III delta prime subunit
MLCKIPRAGTAGQFESVRIPSQVNNLRKLEPGFGTIQNRFVEFIIAQFARDRCEKRSREIIHNEGASTELQEQAEEGIRIGSSDYKFRACLIA